MRATWRCCRRSGANAPRTVRWRRTGRTESNERGGRCRADSASAVSRSAKAAPDCRLDSGRASPVLVALDWGTSNLRAYLMSAPGIVVDRRHAERGILHLPAPPHEGGFE